MVPLNPHHPAAPTPTAGPLERGEPIERVKPRPNALVMPHSQTLTHSQRVPVRTEPPRLGAPGGQCQWAALGDALRMTMRIVGYVTALGAGIGLYLLGYHGYGVGLILLVGSTALNIEATAHGNALDLSSSPLSAADYSGNDLGSEDRAPGNSDLVNPAGQVRRNLDSVAGGNSAVDSDVLVKHGQVHTASIRRSWSVRA